MNRKKAIAFLLTLALTTGGAIAQPAYGYSDEKPVMVAHTDYRTIFNGAKTKSVSMEEAMASVTNGRETESVTDLDLATQEIARKKEAEERKEAEENREKEAETNAENAVNGLTDENGNILSGLSDETISAAETATESVADTEIKTDLTNKIEEAKARTQQEREAEAAREQLAGQESAANSAMQSVWDFPNGCLKDGATRDMLNDAQAKIEALPDGNETKNALYPAIAAADNAFNTQGFTVNRRVADAGTIGNAGIQIPAGLGTLYTVTMYGVPGWYMSDGEWFAVKPDTGQARVHDAWVASGAHYEDGFAVMNGRYLIACTEKYGEPGDLVTFYLSDGTTLPCVIADQKCEEVTDWDWDPANEWGHLDGQAIIEFEVQPDYYLAYGNPGCGGSFGDFLNGKNVIAAQPEGSAY